MPASPTSPFTNLPMIWRIGGSRDIPIIAQIRAPYRAGDGDWVCQCGLLGLDALQPVSGADAAQAAALAAELLKARLQHLFDGGGSLRLASRAQQGLSRDDLNALFDSIGSGNR